MHNSQTKGFSFKGFAKSVVKWLILLFCICTVGYLFYAWLMYNDYIERNRVDEGFVLAGSAKNLVVDNAVNNRPYDFGWEPITSTKSTASVEIDSATGVITVVGSEKIDNIVFLLTPTANGNPLSGQKLEGRIQWACSEPTGKVPPHKIPSYCR